MPCINCYVDWARQLLPTLLVPLVAWLLYTFGFGPQSRGKDTLPPTYGTLWLGPFRGLVAAYRLGVDEHFLSKLRTQYGDVVYISWPLSRYFVLDGQLVQRAYDTSSKVLSFVPVRKAMQHSVFGLNPSLSFSKTMENHVFPTHAKALQRSNLASPLHTFVDTFSSLSLGALDASLEKPDAPVEIGLVEWTTGAFFDAATTAMFGSELLASSSMTTEAFREAFDTFDKAFPLLASGFVPSVMFPYIPLLAAGLQARDDIVAVLAQWIDSGLPGLEDGLIKEMARIGEEDGWSLSDRAHFLLGDLWAIQANAPPAAVWTATYIYQSGTLVDDLRIEIAEARRLHGSDALSLPSLSTAYPVLSSCITETLRLSTSSFSLREVEQDCTLTQSSASEGKMNYRIPAGSTMVCAATLHHDNAGTFGADVDVWDGRRFLDQDGEEAGSGARRAREVRAFGGGISMCEGRHLATAELKSVLIMMLESFEITPLHAVSADGSIEAQPPVFKLPEGKSGISARVSEGRPVGLGVKQFGKNDLRVRVSKRL